MSKIKVKSYEYQGKKTKERAVPNKKVRNLLLGGSIFVILLVVILLFAESALENKIIIKNRSTHTITSLRLWYEDNDGTMTEVMDFGKIPAKKRVTESAEKLKLSDISGEAWLTVQVSFEDGGEALLQTGQFLNGFHGRVSLELSDTKEEELMLHLQAGEGLFNSTATTNCDDVYYINPKDGYIE